MKAAGHIMVFVASMVASVAGAQAQEPLEALSRWVATVDDTSQLVVLRWNACSDLDVAGYCVKTDSVGDDDVTRWITIDTTRSRLDTEFVCNGYSSLTVNRFRVNSIDDSYTRTSYMTDPFGNVVLSASMSPCDASLTATWTAYEGMPGGVNEYKLYIRHSADGSWVLAGRHSADGTLSLTIPVPDSATVVSLRLDALSGPAYGLVSSSNRLDIRRPTADTLLFLTADTVWYDREQLEAVVRFRVDTSLNTSYTLYRAAEGWPMARVATLPFAPDGLVEYRDPQVNRSDSLYRYLLSATDGCGLNEKFSDTLTLLMPPPVEPTWYFPNVIMPDAEGVNARFCPVFIGLLAEGYELWIYDRVGRLVFHTTDPDACWDGTSLQGSKMPQGGYVFVVHGRFADRSKHTLSGTITLLR